MSLDVMETETLSDEQIDLLLQEAETRLKAKAGVLTTTQPQDEQTLRLDEDKPEFAKRKPIPRLQHGLDEKPYIQDRKGVAEVEPEVLATRQQQKLADTLRSVQVKHKSKKEVRCPHRQLCLLHEEIYPNLSRRRSAAHSELSCFHESLSILKFIVTLTRISTLASLQPVWLNMH